MPDVKFPKTLYVPVSKSTETYDAYVSSEDLNEGFVGVYELRKTVMLTVIVTRNMEEV
jgi:hypothetical protein